MDNTIEPAVGMTTNHAADFDTSLPAVAPPFVGNLANVTPLEARVENLETKLNEILDHIKSIGPQVPADPSAPVQLDELDRIKMNVHKILRHVFGANEANISQPVSPPSV